MNPEDEYYYYCFDGYLEENWMKCSQREMAKKRKRDLSSAKESTKRMKSDDNDSFFTKENNNDNNSDFHETSETLLKRIVSIDFDQQKESIVPGLEQNIHDKSRATHADAAIHPLLFAINHHVSNDYYTTSSCAGRTIITQSCPTSGYNVDWLFITHDLAKDEDVFAAIESRRKEDCKDYEVWLKMEPPIVAICCRDLKSAQYMIDLSRKCGFKKPTITGVHDKVMVSIVDNHRIELPISFDGKMLTTKEYISTVIKCCNEKLIASRERMEKLRLSLRKGFERQLCRCCCTHG